tara:strand:- start:3747 stop:5561 length:1815 start_codon:yes stop_codon:yes gene_type:complete
MARKINLKGLHDNGDLTVTKFNITEDATSDGVSALFDGDTSVLRFQANQHGISSFKEQLKLDFSSNIKGRKFRVRITTGVTDDINLHVNGKVSNLQSISGLGSATTIHTNSFDFSVNSLSQIRISLGNSFSNGDHEVYEIELFIMEEANPYEFNDSVLTTKAWNSSRYDGRQLSGSKINKYVFGDVTYGLTPVVRNLTRTFYISSDITSLGNTGLRVDRASGDIIEDTENPIEDLSLQFIPDFSYIIINKSVTINTDNSITITDISSFANSPEGTNKRIGFDREFQTNIPNGSFIGIKSLDANIKDRSNDKYPVYFNAGRLQPIARVISYDDDPSSFRSHVSVPQLNLFKPSFNSTSTLDGTAIFLPNKAALSTVSTGSFINTPIITSETPLTDDPAFSSMIGYHTLGKQIIHPLFNSLKNEMKNNGIKSFITLLDTPDGGGSAFGDAGGGPDIDPTDLIPPIRTTSFLNVSESIALKTRNLAELSTAQFSDYNDFGNNNVFVTMSQNNQFNQFYDSGSEGGPTNFSGSYDISILNEEKPALLVPLIKKIEFPEGIGRTPLVIIPETLHPFVRDNIPQFMAQAGFDIGDITQINTLDETNQTLS